MTNSYNIYCDESCHLENDRQKAMVLGAIYCSLERTKSISHDIHCIKQKHQIPHETEIKWTKVSPAKLSFYQELIEYFFQEKELRFRGVIIPNKNLLRHESFDQVHDDWYYKMYYTMLNVILEPKAHYRIYLDYKDTRGGRKVRKLHEVLENSLKSRASGSSGNIIQRVQIVHSHETVLLQLADLLIGAVSYMNRGLSGSEAKTALVKKVQELSHCDLINSTTYGAQKVNLLRWNAQNE